MDFGLSRIASAIARANDRPAGRRGHGFEQELENKAEGDAPARDAQATPKPPANAPAKAGRPDGTGLKVDLLA